MLSIRTYNRRRDFIFRPLQGETDLQCYQRAKAERDRLKSKYEGQPVTIELISRTKAFKIPDNFKLPKNHYWCPYCIKPRIFMNDDRLGVKRCSVCGISDQDFYVKLYNGIWEQEYYLYCLGKKEEK